MNQHEHALAVMTAYKAFLNNWDRLAARMWARPSRFHPKRRTRMAGK